MHACILIYVSRYVHIYIYTSTGQRNLPPQLTFLITETLVFSETPVQAYHVALRYSPEHCHFIPIFYITNMDHWY